MQRIKNRDDSLQWTMEAQAMQYDCWESEGQVDNSDDEREDSDYEVVERNDELKGDDYEVVERDEVEDCEGATDEDVA